MSSAARSVVRDVQIGATSALPKIITTGFRAVQLIYFFTAGEDEVRCWQIRRGTKAPQVPVPLICRAPPPACSLLLPMPSLGEGKADLLSLLQFEGIAQFSSLLSPLLDEKLRY